MLVAGMVSAKAALASPIRGRSSKTSTAPSRSPRTSARPERRMESGRGDLQERGLPGPVRTEDHPAFPLVDPPGHLVENASRLRAPRVTSERSRTGHRANLRRVPTLCAPGLAAYRGSMSVEILEQRGRHRGLGLGCPAWRHAVSSTCSTS